MSETTETIETARARQALDRLVKLQAESEALLSVGGAVHSGEVAAFLSETDGMLADARRAIDRGDLGSGLQELLFAAEERLVAPCGCVRPPEVATGQIQFLGWHNPMNHRTETLESIRDQLGQLRDELADLIELERHQSTTTEGKDE